MGLNTVQPEQVVDPLESDNAPISPIGLGSSDGAAVDPRPDDGLHLDSASNVPQMVPDDEEVVSPGSGGGLGEVFGPSKLDESIPVSSLPSGTPERPSALSLLSTYAFPRPGTVSGSNSALLNQSDLAGAGGSDDVRATSNIDDEAIHHTNSSSSYETLGFVDSGPDFDGVGLNTIQLERVAGPLEPNNAPISPIGFGSGDGAALDPRTDDGLHLDSASNVPQMVPDDDEEVVRPGSGGGLGEVFGPSKLDESIPVSSLPSGTPERPSALSLLSPYAFPCPGTVSGSNSALLDQSDLAGAGGSDDMGATSNIDDEAIHHTNSSSSYETLGFVDPGPDFDPSKLAEPVSASSLLSGTPETISTLSNRVSEPPEHFGSVSGLNSAPDDPHLLRDGVEVMDLSGSEGDGRWHVMRATSGTGDEAICHMNSDVSSLYAPPGHIDPGPDSVATEEPSRAISETPPPSAHRLAFGLVSDHNHCDISEPIPEQSPTPAIGSPGPDFDFDSGSLPRVILRSSQRIKAKRHSDSEDPSPKRQKLSEGKRRRTGKTTEARDVDNNNHNMDIGEDCDQLPRLEVHGDKEVCPMTN